MLSKEFLAPYVKQGDKFPTLLSRASYLSKYKREEDANWTDTIRRVVVGNCSLDPNVTKEEAMQLFHVFWTMQALPPGRGLWVGGVPGIPNDAAFNCWFSMIHAVEDWGWVANQLMLGGGVGVGLEKVSALPVVERGYDPSLLVSCSSGHPNVHEVSPDSFSPNIYSVEDSREGWVSSLISVMGKAWSGMPAHVDVSLVRQRGAPIRTFGGTACGPGPLTEMLRSVWGVIRGAAGRRITTVEGLDITNFIGKCVKAGNVRRSALIALGAVDDREFRDAKKNLDAILSHRHTSNNSLNFHEFSQFEKFDWRGLVRDNIEFGEPGLDNLALGKLQDPHIEGVNPCQPAWATVLTPAGVRTMGDVEVGSVVWSGQRWTRVIDKRCTGKKMVRRYRTNAGVFVGTSNHRVVSNGEKIAVGDADSIDVCAGSGTYVPVLISAQDVMDGLVAGDGTYHKATNNVLLLIGEKDSDYFDSEVAGLLIDNANSIKDKAWFVRTSFTTLPKTYERVIPEEVLYGTPEKARGYLRGLFSANGSVVNNRITLKASSRAVIDGVQILLSSLGIRSYITTNKAHETVFENGVYTCRESYDLNINTDRSRFAELIGFLQKYKTQKLTESLGVNGGKAKSNYDIVDVEEIGEELVYDITVEADEHTYWTGGLLVSNCGEVQLRNRESCNLAEVFPALFDGSVNPHRIFQLVTRYALRQRLLNFSDPTAEAARRETMRLGVGLGGICDFEWTEDLLRSYYVVVREEANRYADELGVKRPIATTTVKPSGTISLLNGSNPGIHAPEAPFYLRRMRISDSEPMAVALSEAGVPWEYDIYDTSQHTMVFSFPMKTRNSNVTALTQTLADQFERQLKVQRSWADNAVSSTIKFDKSEAEDMAQYLQYYAPKLKSISMLPKEHGYKQAPYEQITEQQFVQLASEIDQTAKLDVGDLQIEECSHGACPLR